MKENVINYVPLKIYRYIRWKKEEKKKYKLNRKNFGKEYADICLNVDKVVWQNASLEIQLDAQNRKDEYILSELQPIFEPIVQKYKKIMENIEIQPRNIDEKIWVFWWSGEENAPDIVKACIKSIRKNSNGHEVVLLDKNTFSEYIEFPQYILDKRENGIISLAHLADIIRLSLLAKYGGVWVDATVFVSQPLPEYIFNDVFYTAKKVNYNLLYISKSRWCTYFLAGNRNFPFFEFARECFLEYYAHKNATIDYLLFDYIIKIAYDAFQEVKQVFDNIPDNNAKRGLLMEKINEEYSEELFCELTDKDTFISKLSWRYGNPKVITINGKKSNYGHLIEL